MSLISLKLYCNSSLFLSFLALYRIYSSGLNFFWSVLTLSPRNFTKLAVICYSSSIGCGFCFDSEPWKLEISRNVLDVNSEILECESLNLFLKFLVCHFELWCLVFVM